MIKHNELESINYCVFSNITHTSFCWFLKWKKVSSQF